ncbi:C-X-C motif chemokine 16 [Orycteropus afer afer]|uniref:C-X-C motif chemokine 16 n=1 Tax=Orycteropus afer afer TaxID=1230840 RepID=A0A8B7ARB0_ORYAF|nr:C-X-C motif chemokine 16 [Orycteropus afer afer]
MWRRTGPPSRALLLLLLASLTLPGNGNQGSVIGSCHCDHVISTPLPTGRREHMRKHLKGYQRCPPFVRFQLHSRTVCGGSTQLWVLELMSCFDHKKCGYVSVKNSALQKHLPPLSTEVPEPTKGTSDVGTSARMYLPPTLLSTQLPTLPAAAPSLDRSLTPFNETTTPTVGHSLAAGPEAGQNQKQLEDRVGPPGGNSAMVAVLSLLATVFILTGVLLYVLCKRRREQSKQYCPDLQLHYIPVASGS